jgi:putative transposase
MLRRGRQLGFRFRTHGGARAGAGRPPKGLTAGVSHLRRPAHASNHPLHITLRVRRGLPSLREGLLFERVRKALAQGNDHFGFTLAHFSVQRDHLHLIAEANDRLSLARGVQGLSIRVARAVNRHLGRKGRLFADRYHARALKTPRVVRLALRYVLLNLRKHTRAPQGSAGAPVPRRTKHTRAPQGSAGAPDALAGFVDRCSSAPWFRCFDRPEQLAFGAREARSRWARASGTDEPPVVPPRFWLLRSGWKRAGAFDLDETPGVRE